MDRLYEERAWVYDAAFTWDVQEEVNWLLERFGGSPGRLLEPGCGSGRLMPAFAQHGVELVGIDRSQTMLDCARRRMAELGLPAPCLQRADMDNFTIDADCDGALCPINTFGYLATDREAASHLDCVAASLRDGARYLVQLDIRSLEDPQSGPPARWETTSPEGTIRCTWEGGEYDRASKIEIQVSRFEVLDGTKAGQVYKDLHPMRVWNWSDWTALIDRSPFRQMAAYDGSRCPLTLGPQLEGEALTWHELQLNCPSPASSSECV